MIQNIKHKLDSTLDSTFSARGCLVSKKLKNFLASKALGSLKSEGLHSSLKPTFYKHEIM